MAAIEQHVQPVVEPEALAAFEPAAFLPPLEAGYNARARAPTAEKRFPEKNHQ